MPAEDADKKRSQDLIDENLKKAFSDTLDEGVPDRFKDLLAQLKEKTPDDPSEEPQK
ncbi:regulator [Aliiroseovarius sp. S2029]|uniref:NepR family anti-sigma factor n=1 Tax=Aliiroseovarius sp. S2029 TaxID=2936988 RepID=UPI0020BDE2C1|nr:NepR family anti-sigma factor [Aliiroseovarius sp. S2029]MCK8482573.1 regulator [Aliiroseovarius sp. S2029]